MKCKDCGTDIQGGAKTCPNCGAKVQQKGQEKKVFCPTCGDEVSPQWNYCFKKHPLKLFCPTCGKASPGNASFCLNCGGNKLVDSEEFKRMEVEKKQREEEERKQRAPKCPDCGQEITQQQTFCSCGYALKFICSACEEMNPRESSACRSCGNWELINPRLFKQMKEQEKEVEKEKKTPRCENCDERVDTTQTFCDNCHEPLKKACRNCGELSPMKSTICVHCGSRDLLDPRATKKFENLVMPEEIQVNQDFVVSGQVVSFVGTPGDSLVYLKLSNLDEEFEAGPDQGNFEFGLRFSEVGEYGLEFRSGAATKRSFKIKAVRRLTPAEETRSKSPMKRLCLRDGCDTRIEGYQHYCPSRDCTQNQELKFGFWGDNRVFDRLNCKRCWSYEKGLDKFFLDRNDDTFFRTVDHPHRLIPKTIAEVLKQARLYECPICKQRGEARVKQWVLIPESKGAKVADAFTASVEQIGDWIKRGFRATKAAREKQLEISKKKNGGSKK